MKHPRYHLRVIFESEHNRAVAPDLLRAIGTDAEAELFEQALASGDLLRGLGAEVGRVATAIEAIDSMKGQRSYLVPSELDFGSAMRVYGPSSARKGRPLEWKRWRRRFSAVDESGMSWDIVPGRSGGAVGLIVAGWDRPDWYTDSVAEAKLLAAEIAVRPKFTEIIETEIPFD